ncbi:MAG: aminotransferase class III-fold pyridoxal phosphate-dependent enzyme, partial [Deltaproteobacteria bacterium]|nr:aminotransferase class III-fold pyridoxal phosphate-dependent enzyme [Deltaproteobacteria bacterium]
MDEREWLRRHRSYLFPNVILYYEQPLVVERAQGCWVYDHDGRAYLDFFAGILTVNAGHCHPRIVERVAEQVRTLQHASSLYINRPMVELAEKLAQITPGRLQ